MNRGQLQEINTGIGALLGTGLDSGRRKRKSEGRGREDDERSFDRKTRVSFQPDQHGDVDFAGAKAWPGAESQSILPIDVSTGAKLRVTSGRYAGLIGVLVDVQEYVLTLELPGPSRVGIVRVNRHQLKVTTSAPAKAVGSASETNEQTRDNGDEGEMMWRTKGIYPRRAQAGHAQSGTPSPPPHGGGNIGDRVASDNTLSVALAGDPQGGAIVEDGMVVQIHEGKEQKQEGDREGAAECESTRGRWFSSSSASSPVCVESCMTKALRGDHNRLHNSRFSTGTTGSVADEMSSASSSDDESGAGGGGGFGSNFTSFEPASTPEKGIAPVPSGFGSGGAFDSPMARNKLGRSTWRRPRPPGLTLAVDEVDTEVCAGGLTNATKILENLWLSGEEVTGDKLSLQREGVTHVVNCSKRLTNFYPRDFSYHRVSWEDESGQDMNPAVLEAAFRHIDAARRGGKACLVHCKAGTSRSCSLVLGYLMQLGEGMSLLAALEFCQAKRRQCIPNKYFLEKLSEYEERLFGQTTVNLHDYNRGDSALQCRRKSGGWSELS